MNEPADSPIVGRRAVYSGRVQGVGFRFTAVSIARRFPVTGYVKNQPDGCVELVAEGTPDGVDAFLAEVASAFRGNITATDIREIDTGRRYTGFHVRH